jgi:hypothetical protein
MDYLRATIDEEIGKIGPSPSGCGENRAIRRCHPRRWTRHSPRIPPHLHPTDQNLSAGTPGLARCSSANRVPQRTIFVRWGGTPPARKLITGSSNHTHAAARAGSKPARIRGCVESCSSGQSISERSTWETSAQARGGGQTTSQSARRCRPRATPSSAVRDRVSRDSAPDYPWQIQDRNKQP